MTTSQMLPVWMQPLVNSLAQNPFLPFPGMLVADFSTCSVIVWILAYIYVCETRDFTKNPICFTSAELLYVDKVKDLAYLELENEPNTKSKVTFSSKKLSI